MTRAIEEITAVTEGGKQGAFQLRMEKYGF